MTHHTKKPNTMLSFLFFENEVPELAKKQFFIKLKTNPQSLVNKLSLNINKLVADFDYHYPAGQDSVIIYALRELSFYSRIDVSGNYQKTYLELCGLLYTVISDVGEHEGPLHHSLYKKISDLARTTYIKDFGNLPGNMAIVGETTDTIYLKLIAWCPMTGSPDQDYQEALTKLNVAIAFQSNNDLLFALPKRGIALATAIYNKLIEVHKYDVKLATILLKATSELVENPYSPEVQARYYHFSTHAEGAPSVGKKLSSLMLGLLGITMVVSSVFLLAAVAGVTSPVSAFFAAIVGAHLLATATILAPGGTIAILGAVGLFKDGMRHALSVDMYNLAGISHQASVDRKTSPGIMF